jgi:hypothetical protein
MVTKLQGVENSSAVVNQTQSTDSVGAPTQNLTYDTPSSIDPPPSADTDPTVLSADSTQQIPVSQP